MQPYTLYGKRLSYEDSRILHQHKDLQKLIKAANLILLTQQSTSITFKSDINERQHYQITILTHVKTYKPFESFGEIALITDRKRAAKLQVTSQTDAHFIVLSKKDYKKA